MSEGFMHTHKQCGLNENYVAFVAFVVFSQSTAALCTQWKKLSDAYIIF